MHEPTIKDDGEDSYIVRERNQHELGARPAEGDGSAPLRPVKYQHDFWDPELAHLRAMYFKILGMTILMVTVAMWICFSVYWGSLGEAPQHVPNLNGWIVNRDGAELGAALVQAFEQNTQGVGVARNAHLTWREMDASSLPTEEDVVHGVVHEKVWAAVVVNLNATSSLVNARESGDPSYNASKAVTFYWNQGRNEVAANSYIVPYTTALLQTTLNAFSTNFTKNHMASINSDAATTAAALTAITNAPQTVTQPFYYSSVDLRPYTKPVSQAILLVGQIYITIFAFIMTMANDFGRGIIGPFLRFKSYARLRLIIPVISYIPITFFYSMVSLPFHATFGAKWGYAGGFFVFWLYIYMGVLALGLSTEAMITLLTPRFSAYFIIVLVIFNVSGASIPYQLQPGFYKYAQGFPIPNMGQAIRTIMFNTKSHLPKNAGVILGWIALNFVTIPLFTWYMRRRDVQKFEKEANTEAEEKA